MGTNQPDLITFKCFVMKTRLPLLVAALAAFLLIQDTVSAQKRVTWKGGSPGRETDWNYPGNWSDGAVPNCFSDVVIPDVSTGSGRYPVIGSGAFEVNTLVMYSGAALSIRPTARLQVINQFDPQDSKLFAEAGALRVGGQPYPMELPDGATVESRQLTLVNHQ